MYFILILLLTVDVMRLNYFPQYWTIAWTCQSNQILLP